MLKAIEESKKINGSGGTTSTKPKQSKDVKHNAYDFSTGFDHGFGKFETNVVV